MTEEKRRMRDGLRERAHEAGQRARKAAREKTDRLKDGWDSFKESWGDVWKTKKEIIRGIFHTSFSLIAWFLVQVLLVDKLIIGGLLFVIGVTIFFLDRWRAKIGKKIEDGKSVNGFLTESYGLVEKNFVRGKEKTKRGTVVQSDLGFLVAWLVWLFSGQAWIAVYAALLFGFVDPFAKLGKPWPIYRFKSRCVRGKSLGGALFGALFGATSSAFIIYHQLYTPFLPSVLPAEHVLLIFLVGVISAAFAELFGRDWDNFFIPATSSLAMAAAYYVALAFL